MPSTSKKHEQTAENLLLTGNLDDDNEEENLDDKKEEDNLDDESENDSFSTQQLFSFAWQIARGMVTIITIVIYKMRNLN